MNSIKNQLDYAKSNQHFMTYALTTCALMLTLVIQGTIHGNLAPTHFIYALISCIAFAVWAIVDHNNRKQLLD